jgi:hypothetical protein
MLFAGWPCWAFGGVGRGAPRHLCRGGEPIAGALRQCRAVLGFGSRHGRARVGSSFGHGPSIHGGVALRRPSGSSPGGRPIAGDAITFPGKSGELQGFFSPAAIAPAGAMLVIHENRGLTDHIRSVATRLAADGYSSLAVDSFRKKAALQGSEIRPGFRGFSPARRTSGS